MTVSILDQLYLNKRGKIWTPRSKLGLTIVKAFPLLPQELVDEIVDAISSACVIETELRARVKRGLGLFHRGLIPYEAVVVEDHGVVSCKVVTTVGAGFLVDAFQNLVELETMKFHGLGEDNTAENVSDTALGDELTTEYASDGVRATGTTAETSALVYQTVGTNTLDSGTPAIVEHGVFSASSGGVLFDRSVFAAINLDGSNGDGLETDYRLTVSAGG